MTVPSSAPRPTPPARTATDEQTTALTVEQQRALEGIAAFYESLASQGRDSRLQWRRMEATGDQARADAVRAALSSLSALRSEVERLTRERDEARKLAATHEANFREVKDWHAEAVSDYDDQRAESARLSKRVAALEAKMRRIAEWEWNPDGPEQSHVALLATWQRMIRTALGPRAVAPEEGRDRE